MHGQRLSLMRPKNKCDASQIGWRHIPPSTPWSFLNHLLRSRLSAAGHREGARTEPGPRPSRSLTCVSFSMPGAGDFRDGLSLGIASASIEARGLCVSSPGVVGRDEPLGNEPIPTLCHPNALYSSVFSPVTFVRAQKIFPCDLRFRKTHVLSYLR